MSLLMADTIRELKIIEPCLEEYEDKLGHSAGLSVCGYDITLCKKLVIKPGEFKLSGAVEYFNIPINVGGFIMDKSSWIRKGLTVFNTFLEPGWRGYATIELMNHSKHKIKVPKGCTIAQVVFEFLDKPATKPYHGRYQDQKLGPQKSIQKIKNE